MPVYFIDTFLIIFYMGAVLVFGLQEGSIDFFSKASIDTQPAIGKEQK